VKLERASAIVALLPLVTTACVFEFRFDGRASISGDAESDSLTTAIDARAPDNEGDLDSSSSLETSTPDAIDARGEGDDPGEGDTRGVDGPPVIPDAPDAMTPDTAMPDTVMPEAMPPTDGAPPEAAVPPDTLPPVDTLPPADSGVPEAAADPDTAVPVDAPAETP